MASTIYDGSDLRLYVNSGTGAKVALAYAQSCELALSADTQERTHKDNDGGGVWQEITPKTLSGSISFDALASLTTIGTSTTTYSSLFGYFSNRTKIAFVVSTGTSGDKQLAGFGYITDLNLNATDKEDATYNGTLTISGQVLETTVT